ncbi:hypothetical protein [Actinomyces sp. Z5]|uniref:hypothetical protein n=1 Tax=Actinomyces sp. Z5 TaxID=2250216 RepID=UPI0015EB7723|nr:hypothetical protein [Actinomyces sp. Z5]
MTTPNQPVPDQPTPQERFERAVAITITITNAQGQTPPVDPTYCARFAAPIA